MDARRSIWPALLSGLVGLGLIIGGMALPWVDGREGSTLPWRSVLPWDLAQAEVQSMLASIALSFVVLGLQIAWFASEAFRRSRGDLLVSQLEVGAWLALLGAILVMVGAFLTPRWEPVVR